MLTNRTVSSLFGDEWQGVDVYKRQMCIISEEVEDKDMSLDEIVTSIAKVVAERAAQGNNFGTCLLYTSVERGLAAGEQIVTEGFHKLTPGMKVRAQVEMCIRDRLGRMQCRCALSGRRAMRR